MDRKFLSDDRAFRKITNDYAGLPYDAKQKIQFSLIQHAWSHLHVSVAASIGCGFIVFLILYHTTNSNAGLFVWAGFFMAVQGGRLTLYFLYRQGYPWSPAVWSRCYGLGCLLSGIVWGMSGLAFFPSASSLEQALLIFVMAGVSAGSIPLAASVPRAGIAFLVTAIPCYMLAVMLFKNADYYFFCGGLLIYLVYAIVLTWRTYYLVRDIFVLKYENDILLDDLEISNRMLEIAATHDPLTNIPNRRLFQATLEQAVQQAERKNSGLAVFYVDLDNFKQANDSQGHEAGDHILKTIAQALSLCFRKADIVARLGGDEFAIVIAGVTVATDVETISKKICQIVSIPVEVNHAFLHVTASVGVSVYPEDGVTADELITCADHRMYIVKQRGGNSFYFRREQTGMLF